MTWVTLYTDASWSSGVGAWASYARSDEGTLLHEGLCPDWVKDNNEAELYAILASCREVLQVWKPIGIGVRTDSQFAQHRARWGASPARSSASKRVQQELFQLFAEHECKIRVQWVKGHQSNATVQAWLNNHVDRRARLQRLKAGG